MTGDREWICDRGRERAVTCYLMLFLLLKEPWYGSSSAALVRSTRTGAEEVFPVYVRPPDPASGEGSGESIGSMRAGGFNRAVSTPCGSEEDPCPDIRSALQAVPEDLAGGGTSPELRLLPGVYTGDGNVFLGGSADSDYPSYARNVGLVGWNSAGDNNASAVLSCQGQKRQSRADDVTWSSVALRGVWLSEGRITRLANLTVTECPGGGVGVEPWPPGNSAARPSLSSVTLEGNGEQRDCQMGGGLYVGTAAAAADPPAAETRGNEGVTVTNTVMVTDCFVANNTAQLGGGIAIGSFSTASSWRGFLLENASFVEPGLRGREDRPGGDIRLEEGGGVVIGGKTVVAGNRATSGGGVWASGARVSIGDRGVVVKDNVAWGLKEGCGEEESCSGRGGGMRVEGGSLSLVGVSFEGNTAEAHQIRDEYARGGGVSVRQSSSVEATECSFVGNSAVAKVASSAGIGGGAYVDGSNATLRGCHFENNSAEGSDLFGQLASFGGGMATRGSSVVTTISDSTFVGNAVGKGGSGGGLWVEGGATVSLSEGARFLNNSAASSYTHRGAGGAVAVSASSRLGLSDGCVLEGNVAGPEDVGELQPACLSGEGGAIFSSGSGVSMGGVTLRGNRCETGALDAGCSGGAVSVTGRGVSPPLAPGDEGGGGARFEGCVFEGNEARGSAASSVYSGAGQGGAVAIRFSFPNFTDCSFTGNRADGGGGMAPATGGAVLLFLSQSDDAVDGDGNPPTFVDCTFEGNRAGSVGDTEGTGDRGHGIGGALAAIASSPLLIGCSFRNNTAVAIVPTPGRGGGGVEAPMSGASPSFGGAIVLTSDSSGSRLINCTLEDNAAINGVGGDLAVLAAPSKSDQSSLTFSGDSTTATPIEDLLGIPSIPFDAVENHASSDVNSTNVVVQLSGCTFRPPPPQTNPPLPWADGQSETQASPFLFVLDGGTVELVSPVFETSAQAFVARVNRRQTSSEGSHLSIIVEGSSSTSTTTVTNHMAELSIVSVGSSISLLSRRRAQDHSLEPHRQSRSHSNPSSRLADPTSLPITTPDAPDADANAEVWSGLQLDELVLLSGSLELSGGGGGGWPGVLTVSRSVRVRKASICSSPSVAEGDRSYGGNDDVNVTVKALGEAVMGEAWEPKPFFLGTWLAQQILSSDYMPRSRRGTWGGYDGYGHEGGDVDDDVDVTISGDVNVELGGSSRVQGNVHLAGSAVVKVGLRGTLELAGDATFYRIPSSHTVGDADSSSPPPVLWNSGVLSLPRGFSLTVDGGGILQGPSGSCLVVLPPPLFVPSSAGFASGVFDGVRAASGRGDGSRHPLVVQSGGSAQLGGSVDASVTEGAGDAERIKMKRKWALVLFTSHDSAKLSNTNGLAVSGPPGVSMQLSMRSTPGQEDGGEGDDSDDEGQQQWELVVEADFIECGNMLHYANVSAAGGACQACLLNMECAWCGGEIGGGCIPLADRPIKLAASGKRSDGVCQVGDCCPRGCNGVGECDFFTATCSCPWLYAGSSCRDLSTKGAVALSLSFSIVLLLMLTVVCGRSSRRKQMEAVVGTLQELRRGLLADTDGSIMGDDDSSVASVGGSVNRMAFPMGGRGRHVPGGPGVGMASSGGAIGGGSSNNSGLSYQHMWPRDYIQDLQQNLALRDVMVAFNELRVSHKIGSGAAGSVWKGSWRGAAVAIKVIRQPFHQAVELTGRDLEVFKKEAYLMTRLRHPNIVLIMGVTFAPPGHRITLDGQESVSIARRKELGFNPNTWTSQGSLCIVTELLSRGSLEDVIQAGALRTASYRLILHLALQAARGMLYLHTHSPKIVHRDLKSSNLVVDDHWHVKVTDFGMSRFVPESEPRPPKEDDSSVSTESTPARGGSEEEKHGSNGDGGGDGGSVAHGNLEDSSPGGGGARRTKTSKQGDLGLTTNLGTVAWAAPEMFMGGGEYTAKVDVYSFGVVLWELWERRRPFEELRSRFDIADTVTAGGRPPIGRGCPPTFSDLIRRCWNQDPTRRPSFHEIVEDLETELGAVESMTEL